MGLSARSCFAMGIALWAFARMVLKWYAYDSKYEGQTEELNRDATLVISALGYTGAFGMLGLSALLQKGSQSGMLFAAAFAALFFKEFVGGWWLVDAMVASDPVKNPSDPDEDGYKNTYVIGQLGVTAAFGIFAFLTSQLAKDNMKDAAIGAGFTAWTFSSFVKGWYTYHVTFEEPADAAGDADGFKAATLIAGLSLYAAWLIFGHAALQLKGDGPGMGPMLFYATLSCYMFSLGTQEFATYDQKAELQTDEDTIKAGQFFAGLALTTAWLAGTGSAVQFKANMPAMLFVLGLSFVQFAFMCAAWSKYDTTFEKQDDEDTLKAGAVFEALGYTLAWLLCTAAAVLAMADPGAIVFYGGGGYGAATAGGAATAPV